MRLIAAPLRGKEQGRYQRANRRRETPEPRPRRARRGFPLGHHLSETGAILSSRWESCSSREPGAASVGAGRTPPRSTSTAMDARATVNRRLRRRRRSRILRASSMRPM